MPVDLVSERFPVTVLEDGEVTTQFLPVRSIWEGQENQLFVLNPNITKAVISIWAFTHCIFYCCNN